MKRKLLSLLLILLPFMRMIADGMQTITNDIFWNTVEGTPIYSQGGGIFRFTDPKTGKKSYYWYGVHYKGAEIYRANPVGKVEGTGFKNVTCYQSDDLVNWTFVNNVLTKDDIENAFWVGRMGVAYVPEAKKYAIFIQHNKSVLIATCTSPTGNFRIHNQLNMESMIGTPGTGDQTVFTDDNGKSYLVYSRANGRNRIYISEIGYKDGKITLLNCKEIYKGAGREGNCMFKYKNKYYICASDLFGWNASNVYYLESDSVMGPYTPTNNMLKMPGAAADYGHVTQTGFFYTVKGSKQETVIYCGDRWSDFAGNGYGYNQWVPLSFHDGKPYFNSLSQWSININTGEWKVGKDNNYIRNGSFEADRKDIPSGNKPIQEYLTGWNFEVVKGNDIAVGSSESPVLNASNTSSDRKMVIGNKCLNITDSKDFTRRIYQLIESTEFVPVSDGIYTLTAMAKRNRDFNRMTMYATSNGKTYETEIDNSSKQWHRITIKNIIVRNGKVEVGFKADGKSHAWCRIDDVSLTKNK